MDIKDGTSKERKILDSSRSDQINSGELRFGITPQDVITGVTVLRVGDVLRVIGDGSSKELKVLESSRDIQTNSGEL